MAELGCKLGQVACKSKFLTTPERIRLYRKTKTVKENQESCILSTWSDVYEFSFMYLIAAKHSLAYI